MFDKYFVKIIKASTGEEKPIPNKYISLTSYVSTPHQRQDLDSFQDNLGHLHRNTLEHTRSKLEWNTPPLYEREIKDLQNILNDSSEQYKYIIALKALALAITCIFEQLLTSILFVVCT